MNIYLAARYSRREELCGYREQLREIGHIVPAVWLNGSHQINNEGLPIGEHGEALVEGHTVDAAKLREKFAKEDFRDVVCCDLLIAFTEQPRSGSSRGGRHVEFGVALGRMKRVWIVGPRENLFCWIPDVIHFETWEKCLKQLRVEAGLP